MTQINIGSEKLYLSPILDMFNGEIISYNISRSPNLEQVYDMLDKAFARFDCLDGLILHSDQGWHISIMAIVNALKNTKSYKVCLAKGTVLTTQ